MNEGPEAITVKVKYDSNKDDTIDVKISPNTAVSDFERAIQNELKKNNINDIPVELLKFNGQELDDKNKTLGELGIKDASSVENENRVVLIKAITGKTIYITCDENTTVRESLKQLKSKYPKLNYIMLCFAGVYLQRSTLDQKLLGCQIGEKSIKYGSTLHLIESLEKSDTTFDLNNLEESKNSNLVKVSKTSEKGNNVFNSESLDDNPGISSDSKKESKNSNYPLLRIIVGIADLLLLAAAVTTFLLFFLTSLSFSIAFPIVLTVLFVATTILFFGGNNLLPKSWLGRIDLGTGFFGKGGNRDKDEYKKAKEIPQNEKGRGEGTIEET